MAYSDKVIEHYENPRNVGTLDKDDDAVGTGLVGAPACGDVMRLQIKVGDELAHSSIRFGLGRFNTEEEVDYVADLVVEKVTRLRELSPLWEMHQEGIDLKSVSWVAH